MTQLQRMRSAPLLVILSLVAMTACKKDDRPLKHPNSGVYERNATRIALVDLVVDDEARAQSVKQSYIDIETLVKEREVSRLAALQRLSELASNYQLPEDKLHAVIHESNDKGAATFKSYIRIQMRLRKQLSEDEFARLDRVR